MFNKIYTWEDHETLLIDLIIEAEEIAKRSKKKLRMMEFPEIYEGDQPIVTNEIHRMNRVIDQKIKKRKETKPKNDD